MLYPNPNPNPNPNCASRRPQAARELSSASLLPLSSSRSAPG